MKAVIVCILAFVALSSAKPKKDKYVPPLHPAPIYGPPPPVFNKCPWKPFAFDWQCWEALQTGVDMVRYERTHGHDGPKVPFEEAAIEACPRIGDTLTDLGTSDPPIDCCNVKCYCKALRHGDYGLHETCQGLRYPPYGPPYDYDGYAKKAGIHGALYGHYKVAPVIKGYH